MKRPLYYTIRPAPGWWWVPAWRKWLNVYTQTTGDGRAAREPRTVQNFATARTFKRALWIAFRCPAEMTVERCRDNEDGSACRIVRRWTFPAPPEQT